MCLQVCVLYKYSSLKPVSDKLLSLSENFSDPENVE
jgi:hypothetical protein